MQMFRPRSSEKGTQLISVMTPVLYGSSSPKYNSAPKTISLLKTAIAPISTNGLQIQAISF